MLVIMIPYLTCGLGVCSAVIQSGGIDVLRDEAFAYAFELKEAGVEVEMHCFQGLPHCFPAILSDIPETSEFLERFTNFVQRHCG